MRTSYFFRTCALPLLAGLLAACTTGQTHDLLIVGGQIVDGTGAPPKPAAIAIDGDRITAVAPSARGLKAKRIIDATGYAVAPGFIDPHSHVPESIGNMAGAFLDEQDLTQGVTTIVAGPDGAGSPASIRAFHAEAARRGSAVNHACYIGHNGIREQVMPGQRRAATDNEVARMAALVREGMQMGCVGLSTGLMYDPGMFASEAEVQDLARAVKPFGGSYDTHTRDPGFKMLESETEAVRLGEATGVPVKLAHLKAVGLLNKGRIGEVIAMVEAAQARGVAVVADQYPFDGATVRYIRELFLLPSGKAPDQAALKAALADPKARAAMQTATEQGVNGGFSWVKAVGYGSMRIVDAPDAPELVDRNIELLAKEWGLSPFDTFARLATEHQDLRLTLGSVDEADIQTLMRRPWVMIASDGFYADQKVLAAGKAHPRSWGSFTRVLGHYSRDVGLFPLQEAVRRMTSLPADHLGLVDRGRIAPGKAADIVIFDPATVNARSTYLQPSAPSAGIRTVLVNGREVLRDGKVTGDTPGIFLKRQAAPK
ncbi:amidohydrolase family protein [Sandaracinobacter neustonicus]|uniref:Amidohydrolase family protein n=1 Tax=Sandaracinobacter neustonicus TaxID=1715348 RepID=A0A501XML1_9SPHN|nr:amidohydrolase family protein [Sandaracinobacter neustonicus]TPE61377.1 amidohydrolase family protein [Sandaracinobacter neustonicus]